MCNMLFFHILSFNSISKNIHLSYKKQLSAIFIARSIYHVKCYHNSWYWNMWIIFIDALMLWKDNYVLNDDILDHKIVFPIFGVPTFSVSASIYLCCWGCCWILYFSPMNIYWMLPIFNYSFFWKNRIVVNFPYFLIHFSILWQIQIPNAILSQSWSKYNVCKNE